MAMKSPSHRDAGGQVHHPKSPTRPLDVEAELGIHPARRPTDIEHDVNDLGQKKKVSSMLRSPQFKDELETVVTDLLRSGDGGGHVIAREIANILSPINRSQYSLGDGTLSLKAGVGCVSPINDITGSDASLYSKGEKLMRCKLAALYRLVDLHGWSQSIYNHISLRVNQEQEHFLINPFGLLYHEVSASKLLKITMQGDVVDRGTTTLALNKAGFILHSAIHSARPDLKCIIHVHTPDVVAVSMMEKGLLPLCQEAMVIGDVSYHDYQGLVVDAKEKKLLAKNIGPNNKVMFLRNHGVVACGETVEEAYHYLFHVMLACQTQVKAMSCLKQEKLVHLDKAIKAKTHDVVLAGTDTMPSGDDNIKWEVGEMMFEANMRMLDNMGYRTGYLYHNPVTMHRKAKQRSNIELEDLEDGRARLHSHPPHSRWVNSPNQYTKVKPISEDGSGQGSGPASVNGDVSPKSRTRWRSDGGSSHGTPVRIADANQFVPKNTDPREFAEKRKKIRGQGRWDERGPGPQSQKLEGVAPAEHRGPPQGVTTGSKGIIQRDYHAETIVTGPPNPFASVSAEELKSYQMEVTKKNKKESDTEEVFEQDQTTTEQTIEVVVDAIASDEIDGGAAVNGIVDHNEQVAENQNEVMVPQESVAAEIPAAAPAPEEPKSGTLDDTSKEVREEKKEVLAQSAVVIEEPAPKSKEPEAVTRKEVPQPEKDNSKDDKTPAAVKTRKDENKEDPKGKHKKNKKRRSLSFLKKNKEKKEHKDQEKAS